MKGGEEMNKTIIGVFTDSENAERAISHLESKQYNPKDISIVMKDRSEGKKLGQKTGANVGEGAISGATTGGMIGALAGLLVAGGIIPGLGALFIGGPLVAALGLSGAAATTVSGVATGALAGGIVGVLSGLGLSGKEAAEYEESIKQGGILVAVPARSGQEEIVWSILEENGADKIRAIGNYDETVSSENKRIHEDDSHYTHMGAKGGRSDRE